MMVMNVSAKIGVISLVVLFFLGRVGYGRVAEVSQAALDSSLISSVQAGDADAVVSLLQQGASPDAGMVSAAQARNVILLRLLLDKGAKVNARSKSGSTALHTAALQGGIEVVRLLLEEGADPNVKNDQGQTPLHFAISGDCEIDSVKLLIEAGSRLDIPDNNGVTPIRHAAIRGQTEAYKLLLAASGGVERRAVQEHPPNPDLLNKSTAELIADLGSKDYASRQAAEAVLVSRGSSIMPEVFRSIESGTGTERFYELFQKMGPEADAAIPTLRSKLGEKKHVFAAAITLERMKPGALESLPNELRTKAAATLYKAATAPQVEDEMIRALYAGYMYRFGEVATPYVLKLLRSDNPKYRDLAAGCIDFGFYHDDAVERELIKMLAADDDLRVRQGAAQALGKGRTLSKEAKAALLAVIRSPLQPDTLDPAAYDEKKARRNNELRLLSDAAARSLGKAGPSIIDDLIPMLSPIDAPERRMAILAIQSIGAPAVPRLIGLLAHDDVAVATSASVALSHIRGPAVVELAQALASRNQRVIEHGTSALWWIGSGAKAALPALLEVAGSADRSDIERLAAARAALKIDRDSVRNTKSILSTIPMLVRILEQGRFQHQAWAAEALGGIGQGAEQALPMLRKRLALPGKDVNLNGFVADYVKKEAERAISAIEAELAEDRNNEVLPEN
ncbi:MAG: hypothetical protein GX594_10785 [Pirellulaceae bacterium]|nr:hypothetical protein [Pirellulaceae bacterium]